MSNKRYTEEFKIAAVKQVAQRGHPVSEVAERLGVSTHSLYAWTKRYGMPEAERKAVDAQSDEMRRLKAELKRVMEERDILKKAAAGSTGQGNTWASLSPDSGCVVSHAVFSCRYPFPLDSTTAVRAPSQTSAAVTASAGEDPVGLRQHLVKWPVR